MNALQRQISRRDVLRATGGVAVVGLAGCQGGDGGNGGGGNGGDAATVTPEQQLDTPVAGDAEAALTVAAFEDFACPHCATYSLEVLPQIWSEYVEPGDVRYEWYDFPIPVADRHSWLAADAARSVQANADSIDAFWTFTERVFENQNSLSLDTYETLANEVGVDGSTVRQETEERTYEPTVRASRQTGLDRDVSATPTVFVGDEALEAPSYEDLSGAIDSALDAA